MQRHSSQSAFSLVELSIVLVILGLLVGGILSGQALIRAAELRAVTNEQQRYVTAFSAFRDKYFALPGDFIKATDFGWTTNGDNNGQISGGSEPSAAWLHLSNAGLVEGTYTAVTASSAHTIGTNNPRSKVALAGWNVLYTANPGHTSADLYASEYGNALYFGAGTTLGSPTGVLRAEEAWNIDTKMDDGRPNTGTVLGLEKLAGSATAGCSTPAADTSTTAPTNVQYALANTSTTACALILKTGY